MQPENTQIEIYKTETVAIPVRFEAEEAWTTQAQMAALFGRSVSVVSRYISDIYSEGELSREATFAEFAIVAEDGKNRGVAHFALDVVIAVGFRVKSSEGTKFRQWAIKKLKAPTTQAPTLTGEAFAAFCVPMMERMFDSFEARINASFETRLLEAKAKDPRVAVVDYEGSLEVCDAEHIPSKGRGGFLRSLSAILMRATLEKGAAPRILAFGKSRILQFPVEITQAWRCSDEGKAWIARVKRTLALRQNGQTVLPFPVERVRRAAAVARASADLVPDSTLPPKE